MSANKDSAEVVKFMALFQKLKNWIDDDPKDLSDLAAGDESIRNLCTEVWSAAISLSSNERRRRTIFAAPVDPKFIDAWRDYEDRYDRILTGIQFSEIFPGLFGGDNGRRPTVDTLWNSANHEAGEQADAIEGALDFANEEISQDWRDFPSGFPERIEDGVSAWARLKEATGFNLRGIFRRREIVPFVLIPRHVAARHGSATTPSLFTHLQQAHDAFVFGAPLAAITLMRSILESVLRDHYGVDGKDLEERINNCRFLPAGAGKAALHRLRKRANAILHFGTDTGRLLEKPDSKDFELEIVSLLFVLRSLIESAPDR